MLSSPAHTRKRPRPTVSRLLFSAQTETVADPRSTLAARLLAQTTPILCAPSQSPVNPPVHLHDCFARVVSHHSTILLHSYPPSHAYLYKNVNPVTHSHYRPSDGTLAYTWTTRWQRSGFMMLAMPPRGDVRQERAWAMDAPRAHCIAVAPHGLRVAVGHAGCTRVYHAREYDHRLRMRSSLTHPDRELAKSVMVRDCDEVLAGTKGGMVYRWDLREFSNRPTGTFAAADGKVAVHGLRGGRREREIYVAARGVGVAIWDVRAGVGQGPCRVFQGLEGLAGHFDFDVKEIERGGLLAATGGDCVLLWDWKSGGEPLDRISFKGQLTKRVKFAGWDTRNDGQQPGLWVETDKGLHVVVLGSA